VPLDVLTYHIEQLMTGKLDAEAQEVHLSACASLLSHSVDPKAAGVKGGEGVKGVKGGEGGKGGASPPAAKRKPVIAERGLSASAVSGPAVSSSADGARALDCLANSPPMKMEALRGLPLREKAADAEQSLQAEGEDGFAALLEWRADFRREAVGSLLQPDDDSALLVHVVRIFQACGLCSTFSISTEALVDFLVSLRRSYSGHAFHNWHHALMVFHKCFAVAAKSRLAYLLSQLDLLALLLASLGHDAGHGGVTNAFQVESDSSLAALYNNRSVNENHHCATLFATLSQSRLLAALTRKQHRYARSLIADLILSTDMAVHTSLQADLSKLPGTSDLSTLISALGPKADAAGVPKKRSVLLQAVLHACDLHNPALPWAACRRGVSSLGEELKAQARREELEEVDTGMRVATTEFDQARGEMGFAKGLVAPFWDSLAARLPELRPCCELIRSNASLWRQVASGAPAASVTADEQEALSVDWLRMPVLLQPEVLPVEPVMPGPPGR